MEKSIIKMYLLKYSVKPITDNYRITYLTQLVSNKQLKLPQSVVELKLPSNDVQYLPIIVACGRIIDETNKLIISGIWDTALNNNKILKQSQLNQERLDEAIKQQHKLSNELNWKNVGPPR